MPFDANGNFSLVPGTIVADGMNVLPSQHNPPFQDVANGLSQAVVRDGRAPMTGPLNMNGNKITGVAAGDAPDDVVTNAAIADLGVAIGDGKWSLRDLSPNWLRRDGGLYDSEDYPDLAALLPALPDGMIWASVSSGVSGSARDIIQHEDGLVLFTESGNDTLVYLREGNEWTLKGVIASFAFECAAFGNGIVVATDGNGKTALSGNLQDWSTASTFSGGASGIAFGNGLFVASGTGGEIKTTEDGVSWTNQTSGFSTLLVRIRFVNNIFVGVGSGGTIVTSPDGETWTSRTSGVSSGLGDVTYGSGRYVVVGSDGVILTSTNLTSWAAATSGTAINLTAVTYSSAGFLAMGWSGVARISTNGTSWATTATGASFITRAINFDPNTPNRYIAGGGLTLLEGTRTLPTQFRVPVGPEPLYDWIRAL